MANAALRGRGTADNPPNRFESQWYERTTDDDGGIEPLSEAVAPSTQFFIERSRTILSHNDSPDVGFDTSINPYRGCEHGCIYCYARPTHEYLGFSAGLDFETKIVVKQDAPILLRRELRASRYRPEVIAMSGVTDCYQPMERKLELTRSCLEVLADFRNPVAVVTKNHLVTRDIDILERLAQFRAVVVFVSITTLNPELARKMEPRASLPERRLAAIETLAKAGIPVGVLACPVIPGLTDHELPAILKAAYQSGARFSGYNMLRLPFAVKDLFSDWLSTHYPEKKAKVLNKIRATRDGDLNDPRFGSRMRGSGVYAESTRALFELARKRAGFSDIRPDLSVESFRRSVDGQLELFP